MSDHARLSFSASERWLRCPASVNMTQGLPNHSGPAAEEGTFAHLQLAKAINEWLITGEVSATRFEVPAGMDPEMPNHIYNVMVAIDARYREIIGPKTVESEVKVSLHYMTMRDDLWGTSDLIIASPNYIDVWDLKYGKGIFVEADTSQNRLYLLGKMCEEMKKSKGEVPWVSVRSTIVQPRYPDEEGEVVRYEDFDPNDLLDWMHTTVTPVLRLTDDPPDPVAGEKQCRFCLAKSTCPAVKQKVELALSVFEDQTVHFTGHNMLEETLPETTLPAIEGISDEDVEKLIQVHDQIPFINGYLKSVSDRIRRLLEARDPRLNNRLKLVVARRTNTWAEDENKIIEDLVAGKGRSTKDGYIPRKTLVREKPITAAQALKLKLNPAQKARLQGLVSKSDGGLSIVPWSDPRDNAAPPIPFEPADPFEAGHYDPPEYDFL